MRYVVLGLFFSLQLALPSQADEVPQGTASTADRMSLEALIGKPVSASDGQVIGVAQDIILDPPGKPRLLIIERQGTSRLVAIDFSHVGFHAERGEIQVSGTTASDLLSKADFTYDAEMISQNRHLPR